MSQMLWLFGVFYGVCACGPCSEGEGLNWPIVLNVSHKITGWQKPAVHCTVFVCLASPCATKHKDDWQCCICNVPSPNYLAISMQLHEGKIRQRCGVDISDCFKHGLFRESKMSPITECWIWVHIDNWLEVVTVKAISSSFPDEYTKHCSLHHLPTLSGTLMFFQCITAAVNKCIMYPGFSYRLRGLLNVIITKACHMPVM